MTRDPEKRRAAKRRYVERVKVAKYSPGAAGKDMRGRHSNHARGSRSGRFNPGRLITSHGYVAVRVLPGHPHAWGAGRQRYAYEHILVMESEIGRPLDQKELVHHRNGDKADNRGENLELLTVSQHAKEHSCLRGRDELGRFPPEDLRVREFPK